MSAMTQEEQAAILAAANRVMHMDYPGAGATIERLGLFVQDAELLAGFALQALSGEPTPEGGRR